MQKYQGLGLQYVIFAGGQLNMWQIPKHEYLRQKNWKILWHEKRKETSEMSSEGPHQVGPGDRENVSFSLYEMQGHWCIGAQESWNLSYDFLILHYLYVL
jgi:hypothetical protein